MTLARICPASLAVALLLVGPLGAQESGRMSVFEGDIRQAGNGKPLPGVLLRLDTGSETLSDEDGRFRLIGLEPGHHVFALLTSTCAIAWGEVDLEPGEVHQAELELPEHYGAAAEPDRQRSERRRAHGRLLTREELEGMNAKTVTEAVRRLAPSMVGRPRSQAGDIASISARSRNSLVPDGHRPVVVVDGVRQIDGSRSLDGLLLTDVETLELLPGVSAGWEFGSAGSGGVIKVTTRRGSGPPSLAGAEGCVVPDFPGVGGGGETG